MTEKLPCGIEHLHNLEIDQTLIFQLSLDPNNLRKMM